MYKYSKVAQERFFGQPCFAFLFAFFAKEDSAIKFAHSKFEENADPKFAPRMAHEIGLMCKEAHNALRLQKDNCGALFEAQLAT